MAVPSKDLQLVEESLAFVFAMAEGSFIQVQRASSKGKGLPKHFLQSDFNYAIK